MSYQVGVDVGATFTTAAVVRGGRAEVVSMVPTKLPGVPRGFLRRVGDDTPVLVGARPVPAETLVAQLISQVVSTIGKPAGLAVTHPVTWGPHRVAALRAALGEVTMLSTAAAVAYQSTAPVAVHDLGGSTFTAAVVRGLATIGQPVELDLGGADLDELVFDHVRAAAADAMPTDPTSLTRLRQACTAAKETLSADTEAEIPVAGTRIRLTRAEFEEMARPVLAETAVALRMTIEESGVTPATVLLAGGAAWLPLLTQVVSEELGRPVTATPPGAAAMGAALAAAGLPTGQPEPAFRHQAGTPAPAFGNQAPEPAFRVQTPEPALRGQAPESPLRNQAGAPEPALRGQASPLEPAFGKQVPEPALHGQAPDPTFRNQAPESPLRNQAGAPEPAFGSQAGAPEPAFRNQAGAPEPALRNQAGAPEQAFRGQAGPSGAGRPAALRPVTPSAAGLSAGQPLSHKADLPAPGGPNPPTRLALNLEPLPANASAGEVRTTLVEPVRPPVPTASAPAEDTKKRPRKMIAVAAAAAFVVVGSAAAIALTRGQTSPDAGADTLPTTTTVTETVPATTTPTTTTPTAKPSRGQQAPQTQRTTSRPRPTTTTPKPTSTTETTTTTTTPPTTTSTTTNTQANQRATEGGDR